ncbi:MAG: hypothetical protein HFF84_00585 [Oscillibacter sp.]|nr:hypothetical protein [Oscillibacter sp.]
MQYSLTAAEILKRLGFQEPVGREYLNALKQECGIPLPRVYEEFMEVADNCLLLSTSDIWPGQMIPFEQRPCLLYSRLSEAEKAQTGDYLEIGSDYGAGIVTFGIRVEDLEQEDPPVYLQHEAEPVTQWRIAYEKLSGFLQEAVLNALALVDYGTAEEQAGGYGWEYTDYLMEYWESHAEEDGEEEEEDGSFVTEDTLLQKGIDPSKVKWYECINGGKTFCCYDEAADVFYTGRWDWEEENTLYTIARTHADD